MTMIYVAIGAAAVLLVLVVFAAVQVEDWRRDLTTNVAATAEAGDERLRPIEATLPSAELAERALAAVQALKNWRLQSRAEEAGRIELHFVRTTPALRFKDDIRVRIEPHGGGARLTAESRSRIGLGDLGQNPRNLRELLAAVRAEVPRD
jgi:uncharacterized protein (DUF1499 family)